MDGRDARRVVAVLGAAAVLIGLYVVRPTDDAERAVSPPDDAPFATTQTLCEEANSQALVQIAGVQARYRVTLRSDRADAAANEMRSIGFLARHPGALSHFEAESCTSMVASAYGDPASEAVGRALRDIRAVQGVVDLVRLP